MRYLLAGQYIPNVCIESTCIITRIKENQTFKQHKVVLWATHFIHFIATEKSGQESYAINLYSLQ